MRTWLGGLLTLALTLCLALALWAPGQDAPRLSAQVAAALPQSGVEHGVTAVLLNFRGYDTLLEIAVLLLAVIGGLALRSTQADGREPAPLGDPLLQALARWLAPLMLLVAGYLVWRGGHRPGGAFQAGALLAACGVLLRFAGLLPAALRWRGLHLGLLGGFGVFLGVAASSLLAGRALLDYPQAWAGGLILLIEGGLSLSIGLILLSLFDAPPAPLHATKEDGDGR